MPLIAPFLTWYEPNGQVRAINKSGPDKSGPDILIDAFESEPEIRGYHVEANCMENDA